LIARLLAQKEVQSRLHKVKSDLNAVFVRREHKKTLKQGPRFESGRLYGVDIVRYCGDAQCVKFAHFWDTC